MLVTKEQALALIQNKAPEGFEIQELNQQKFISDLNGAMQFKEVVFGFEGKFYCLLYDLGEGWDEIDGRDYLPEELGAYEVEFCDYVKAGWVSVGGGDDAN